MSIVNRFKAPCLNCPGRHEACWGKCNEFKEYKATIERANAARTKSNAELNDVLTVKRLLPKRER